VCAVEHRDGSGPRTIINHPEGFEHVDVRAKDPKAHGVDKGPLKRKDGYDVMVCSQDIAAVAY